MCILTNLGVGTAYKKKKVGEKTENHQHLNRWKWYLLTSETIQKLEKLTFSLLLILLPVQTENKPTENRLNLITKTHATFQH